MCTWLCSADCRPVVILKLRDWHNLFTCLFYSFFSDVLGSGGVSHSRYVRQLLSSVKSMWEMKLPTEFVSQSVCLHVHASISYSKMSCSASVGHISPEICQYYLLVAHTGESVIVFHLYVQLLALPCTMIQKVQ